MHMIKCILLLSSLSAAYALNFGFLTNWYYAAQRTLGLRPPGIRIAIVGAGAGGSSAAFWIQKANERFGDGVQVDVYEKEGYIGGRSTVVYPYNNRSLGSDELGGSIFIRANKNLYRASQEFGLSLKNLDDETTDFGVWDGELLDVTYRGTWWDKAKLFWRYGFSLSKPDAISKHLTQTLAATYTPDLPTWFSVAQLSEELGLTNVTAQTGFDYLTSQAVSSQYTLEVLEALTRINYAQNMKGLHGLGASVCLAANGASQVIGGNFQIFEGFLKYSKARVYLNTTVTSLTKIDQPGQKIQWKLASTASALATTYDHVILAAPFAQSQIDLTNSLAEFKPPVKYVQLHVTILTTTSFRARPERVGLKPGSRVPKMILTNSKHEPDFRSIAYWRTIHVNGRDEHVFKVFSLDEKSNEWLEDVFGEGTIGWVHRKVWRSYPKLVPTTSFPPIKADDGLWYVNSLEPWISTMETETLSSRNIVDNLLKETFGHGLCPNGTSSADWGEKVYGWDC